MQALEKDRNRRYQTSTELSADIQRYLQHDPVLAGPPSSIYRLRRLLRKHRVFAVSVASVLISLALGLFVSVFLYFDTVQANAVARRERDTADRERRRADDLNARSASSL